MEDLEGPVFSGLTPDFILNALESAGLQCDGRLLALNSYENRVYQVGIEGGAPLVAKFYRPARWSDEAILEEHGFVQALSEQEIPSVPAMCLQGVSTLRHFGGHRFAVFPRQGGRAPEIGDPDTLKWIGRFIGRIHAVAATQNYQFRPKLDIDSFGVRPRQFLLESGLVPLDIEAAYHSISEQAIEGVRESFARAGTVASIRLHGDCHAGNILWNELGPHFVDFDDSRTGPAMQDLWMLLSGDEEEMSRQFADVLAGYEAFMEFNPAELHLIEALRTLRLIHYSAWLAQRWNDPAFPVAFPWFNTQRYWQDRILELREQVALMRQAPIRIT